MLLLIPARLVSPLVRSFGAASVTQATHPKSLFHVTSMQDMSTMRWNDRSWSVS